MNYDQLSRNVGRFVKLMPPACHLNAAGEVEGCPNEDWKIEAVERNRIVIRYVAGHAYQLAGDHVRNYTTDPKDEDEQRGFLTLLVQIYIDGMNVSAVPTPYPGAAVLPRIDHQRKARAFFAPELQRALARQIAILDRVTANYSMTSHGKANCPGDTWMSLIPYPSGTLADATMFHHLPQDDAEMLAEFNAAVREVTNILQSWIASDVPLTEYNAWNFLMHKVERSVRTGMSAARRFCPDCQYDATMPASGTLLTRAERSLSQAEGFRAAFLKRHAAPSRLSRC